MKKLLTVVAVSVTLLACNDDREVYVAPVKVVPVHHQEVVYVERESNFDLGDAVMTGLVINALSDNSRYEDDYDRHDNRGGNTTVVNNTTIVSNNSTSVSKPKVSKVKPKVIPIKKKVVAPKKKPAQKKTSFASKSSYSKKKQQTKRPARMVTKKRQQKKRK